MNGVQKHNGIDALQRPLLPFLDEEHGFIGHIGDQRRRHLNVVKLMEMILNFPCAHALGVEGYDLILNSGAIGLVFFDHQRLKLVLTVTGNLNLLVAILAGGLVAFAIVGIPVRFDHRPWSIRAEQVLGTQVLLDAAKASGITVFLHVSTDEVYGELYFDPEMFFTEEAPI